MHVSNLAIEQVEHLGYFCVKALLQIIPGRLAIILYIVCERIGHIPRDAHLASGTSAPGLRPGTSNLRLGVFAAAGVPNAHLSLWNRPRTILHAVCDGDISSLS